MGSIWNFFMKQSNEKILKYFHLNVQMKLINWHWQLTRNKLSLGEMVALFECVLTIDDLYLRLPLLPFFFFLRTRDNTNANAYKPQKEWKISDCDCRLTMRLIFISIDKEINKTLKETMSTALNARDDIPWPRLMAKIKKGNTQL